MSLMSEMVPQDHETDLAYADIVIYTWNIQQIVNTYISLHRYYKTGSLRIDFGKFPQNSKRDF